MANEVLKRLRVIKVFDLEQLMVLLSLMLSQIKNKQVKFDLRMIVIDSLSSLFAQSSPKQQQYFQQIKDLLYYLKSLTKRHNVCVVYTNNTRDASQITKVTELKNLVHEPLSWAVDKQIFASQNQDSSINYFVAKH
jgi:predicted ATP-dependent serine protease